MAGHSQFQLLRERRFAPLFWTQFLGAANDNLFKFAFTLLATYHAAEWGGVDPGTAGFVIGAIFIAPYLFFSATAGQLADRYEHGALIRFVKNLEIGIMVVAAYGFMGRHAMALYACVFLMGLHSTLFGPVKYAYLPQHLLEEELTGGNGLVEMGTFVAILLGTISGGVLLSTGSEGAKYVAFGCLAIAALGRVSAGFIPISPAPDPTLKINWNPFTETWDNLRVAARHRTVFLSLMGISWLWFVGSIFLTSFTPFSRTVLGGDENVVTLLLAVFSVGIGIGSLLCERLSGHKVEIGLVPFGSIGMTVFAVDLWLASRGYTPGASATVTVAVERVPMGIYLFLAQQGSWRIMVDLFLVAMFSGFYSVPLYALIQSHAEPSHRARIIAANNILNALFMIVASLMAGALLSKGLTIPQLFGVVGLMNAAVAAYIYFLVPEFLMRFLCWILVHTVYRLRTTGLENIPAKGPAVIICNHVSFVDPLVLMAASPRPITFVMDHRIFKTPVLSFVFRTSKAIPIAPAKENQALLDEAYERIAKALAEGELVAIFPEGRITDTGDLYPFRGGITRILERSRVPVVPMALQGLWGSFFSRKDGPAMSKPQRAWPFKKIGLVVAPIIQPEAVTPEGLQEKVLAMRGDWR
ncbi:Lysophospholipid transporter LplT [Usitatibacter rugosus]|uniref:Lysophospholipid transporter LplT n=1 Tax=Usitatibacter rugosus TaxID=2732067 RepID=A0A6M4GTY5_9PROT|nr:MFS transporter [Usitatibacter rugosus]QJR10482.1 Lysophospholipid transporter LplT [Usitatibacter rugosus]